MEFRPERTAGRGIEAHGILNTGPIWWNLTTPALYELALQRREGLLANRGPLVVRTGEYTGRSPNDRFFVREPTSEGEIEWGKINRPFEEKNYDALRSRLVAYLQGQELFVQDCYAGADPEYRVPIRIITQTAWHSLFARNMFLHEPDSSLLERHIPAFTVIDVPGFHARPEIDGTLSEVFILIHLGRREVLIGGTLYAGEIKKSIFTVMSYLLPPLGVLPMHCSATCGRDGTDAAVLFGLSGTGKTTLSADPERMLLGDDEHGWSDRGIFNFEGGCYAKAIRLNRKTEPEIFETTRRFGTILENVCMDMETRHLDLDDDTLTENTRASYPIMFIPNSLHAGVATHPRNIVMLTADAFGVLPPVARLTPAQAIYQFLSGYTAKVAGTERGIDEPQATFSACFGAPFMVRNPVIYANLLGEKIAAHGSRVWLINTGWSGGPYGVGSRIRLSYTRAILHAALAGGLDGVDTESEPFFGLVVPRECPGVPKEVLNPRNTWKDKKAYDEQARRVAGMFEENFVRFSRGVTAEVRAAGMRRAS